MAARPDPQLLANGDILVPAKADDGHWRMVRIGLDDATYAEWLRVIQQQSRGPGLFTRGVAFWVSAALVLIALWVFIILAVLVGRAI
jgi:hypothetical protein